MLKSEEKFQDHPENLIDCFLSSLVPLSEYFLKIYPQLFFSIFNQLLINLTV